MLRWTLAIVVVLLSQARANDLCTSIGYGNATTTPDLTQGPYHITEVPELFRSNVTEGQDGIPMHLEITVVDTSCKLRTDVLVEIWHANATGYYSGVVGQMPEQGEPAGSILNEYTTFLRGVVEVDASGVAVFDSIVPGRYEGRAFHVHYAVHVPTNFSGSEGAEWDSAYISHIGQIFFQDAIGDTVHEYPPYSTVSNASVTYLDEDNVYAPTGDTTLIGDYTPVNPGSFAEGAVVAIQAVVDLTNVDLFMGDYVYSNTTDSTGMGGGAGGPMPSGMGGGAMGGAGGAGVPAGGMGGPSIPTGGSMPSGASPATNAAGRKLRL